MSVDYIHFASGKAPTPSVRAVMLYQENWLKENIMVLTCVLTLRLFIVDVLRKVPLASLVLHLFSPCKDVFK